MTEDDLRARLRNVEETTGTLREDVAALKSQFKGVDRTVEAFAPALREINEIHETANRALEKAEDLEHERDQDRSTSRASRWQLITTLISISALMVSLAGLVFLILTFAGAAGHG